MSANPYKHHFYLDDNITFLNFGSFGAIPKPVMEAYHAFQMEQERNPVQFITNHGQQYLKTSKRALADFIHCDPLDIVMVTNPSYAVNTIAKSLKLQAGDEILTTNLEYGACDKTWLFVCQNIGATYRRQPISLPLMDSDTFVDELFSGVNAKTKLIFISHITSTTALILPVEKVIEKAKSLQIDVFVDGAHVPGHIPLDITKLGATYYTGACHKWMMTPKGSSFMYVEKSRQSQIFPLIVSWGYNAMFPSESVFLDWHTMNGTRDFTAFLCIPAALDFMKKLSWDQVGLLSREMVRNNAQSFASILNSFCLAPLTDEFLGQMLSVEIKTQQPELLYKTLIEKYRIEIPVMRHDEKVYIRYSINGFNEQRDLDTLFDALKDIITKGLLIEI